MCMYMYIVCMCAVFTIGELYKPLVHIMVSVCVINVHVLLFDDLHLLIIIGIWYDVY